MKIKVNDEEIFELSETQKKVICYNINEDEFEEDMKQRLEYIITHKYERCLDRLKNEWVPKLSGRFDMIPTKPEELCNLIFSQHDYCSRKKRDEQEKKEIV